MHDNLFLTCHAFFFGLCHNGSNQVLEDFFKRKEIYEMSFKIALNASTLFPFKLDVEQQIKVAAEAGYEGIELWMRDIEAYLAQGGSLSALKRTLDQSGLVLANTIAFFKWADQDEKTREEGFQQAKKEMTLMADLGCEGIAAPPFGQVDGVSYEAMAGYYARLVMMGRQIGIEPYLEFWGRAKRLHKLSQAIYVAMESQVADPKLLLDPFHMYTGGSQLQDMAFLEGKHIGIVHVNDYPALPERNVITDADRVFPGDGIAPSHDFAKSLVNKGYQGFLSLELFISDYQGRNALEVASFGLEKVKQAYQL